MGSGKYGLETLRDRFGTAHQSRVMLIYDVWKEKGKTERTQVRTPYMNIEDIVKEFGDFIYGGWYTEGWFDDGRIKASLWAIPDDEHSIDPVLYENWKSGRGYNRSIM